MAISAERARVAVTKFIDDCNVTDYVYSLRQIRPAVENAKGDDSKSADAVNADRYEFLATWSAPTKEEPVPTSVACVTYYVSADEEGSPQLSYRIENEAHVRAESDSIGFSQQWLHTIVRRKQRLMAESEEDSK